MRNSRKGVATVKVLAVSPFREVPVSPFDEPGEMDAWVDVLIVKTHGQYEGIGAGSERIAGESDRVRFSLATFVEQRKQAEESEVSDA